MDSLHLTPAGAGNASPSDSGSSIPQHTPSSNASEEGSPASRPMRSPAGPLRLQTNFEEDAETGGSASDIDDNVYDSGEELEGKDQRTTSTPEYTVEEEKEIVRIFDRRLVPFLALLYLLAFLDRSSMQCSLLLIIVSPACADLLVQISEMPGLQDCKKIFNFPPRSMNGFSPRSTSRTSFSNG